MTKIELIGLVLTALGLLGSVAGALWREIRRLGSNHLKHVDEKLDAIHADVRQVDSKLDRHLEWHLDQRHGR